MTFEAGNILIAWPDDVGGYQFERNPDISLTYRILKHRHVLGNLHTAEYYLGAQVDMVLTWAHPKRFIRGDQYAKFIEIYNLFLDSTVAVCVYPEPNLLPDKYFLMKITNDFDFDFIEGITVAGYQGTMVLEGTAELSEIPTDATLMES